MPATGTSTQDFRTLALGEEVMRTYTPAEVRIKTPDPHIDQSFDMAVELIDHLRTCARKKCGRDGYYGVSDGQYNPCHTWDSRDYDHVNKIYAYLWSCESNLGRIIGENIFVDQLEDGHLKWCYGSDQRGMHIGHYCKYAADYFRYIGDVEVIAAHWTDLLAFVRWVFRAYDPDGIGLIADASPEAQGAGYLQSFWGYYIGEPEHFPVNLSRTSRPVIATMTFCGLLQEMSRFAAEHDMPEGEWITAQYRQVKRRLEGEAYSERRGYYYIQYDDFNHQWYFSLNGTCEESRELLVIPYYADEIAGNGERARNVARYVYWVLHDEAVFPMPITYPFYRWYGASTQYHYHAFGMDRFLFKGCWDNSYHNCVNLLSSTGLIDVIPEAVRRRSEAACRDGDFIEWYFRDGSVGETGTARQYHRDRYGISATAHIASIVEGLFGIRPSRPGFAEVRIQPAFPLMPDRYGGPNRWVETDIEICISLPGSRRLECAFWCAADRRHLALKTNDVGLPSRVRLPVYGEVKQVEQGGQSLAFTQGREMDGEFVYFDALLDGREIGVSVR